MVYKCILKIDGLEKKLSLDNGPLLKDIGELLTTLGKCLEKRKVYFRLVGVKEASYGPEIVTEQEEGVDEFNKIHKSIQNEAYEDLDADIREYCDYLQRVLFKNGLFLTTGNDKDDISTEIKTIQKQKSKETFYSVNTITGVVTTINGVDEEKPFFILKTSQDVQYKITITPQEELKIKDYYKTRKIQVRIRTSINAALDNKIGISNLIDWEPLNTIGFFDSIKKVKKEFGDIFINIDDSAKLLNSLRNE